MREAQSQYKTTNTNGLKTRFASNHYQNTPDHAVDIIYNLLHMLMLHFDINDTVIRSGICGRSCYRDQQQRHAQRRLQRDQWVVAGDIQVDIQ